MNKEFTPAIDCLVQKIFKSSQKYNFPWNPSVALDYCSPRQSQCSILPIFIDWSQDELELQNKMSLLFIVRENGQYNDLPLFIQ